MHIIVGLGNPGSEYEKTRHNAGFMAIDLLQKEWAFAAFKEDKKMNAELSSGTFNDEKVILVKPLTFMNNSGEAVQKICQFYKIKPESCLVIYDDLDLPLGKIRLRTSGSPGTHNGMKSITQNIGDKFPRLRIGIESRGTTAPKQMETSPFVLGTFFKEELPIVKTTLQTIIKAIESYLKEGLEQAMNKFNA